MEKQILVVDDEKEIADLVELYLKCEGFTVFKYYHAREALECIGKEKLDMAILDIMMPEMDGFSLCRKIRENYCYPVMMLTAKGEEVDKITGLSLGADDYLTKPFRPLELVARVKAQLRRYTQYNRQMALNAEIVVYAGLIMDAGTHRCLLNEKELSLTPTEFSILWILCKNKGKVVNSEDLFRQIWGEKYYSKNNSTITVHIRHIREKMGDSFENPNYIKTVWGCGYKIEN